MKKQVYTSEQENIQRICNEVRKDVEKKQFTQGIAATADAMRLYPHAPEPHNLLGLLLEITKEKGLAMKHYRAALALDPTYRPARQNMERCGNLHVSDTYAFDESDCIAQKTYAERIKYDSIF